MKEYVAKRSRQAVSKNDIIAISNAARREQKQGIKVINASIGMMLDDDKCLSCVPLIQKAIHEHVLDDLSYGSSIGNERYLLGVKKFFFREALGDIEKNYSLFAGATLGGTGAICAAFHLFLEQGEAVLLPDIMWSNYMLVAKKAGDSYLKYSLLDQQGHFNLRSLKQTIEKGFASCSRLLVVINDPCQNPTGYCLSEEEYQSLFDLLDEESSRGYLTVLFDTAYMRFYQPQSGTYALMTNLRKKTHRFLPAIAFSTSKVFGLYGLRLGALFVLCHNETNKDRVYHGFEAFARSTYSVPVGAVQNAVANVLLDDSLTQELDQEIDDMALILQQRGNAMKKALSLAGIETYPYTSGFFITLKVNHAVEVCAKLREEHIYLVPLDGKTIRVALSGLDETEADRIVDFLSAAIASMN